ncbi:MAG: extracellular solute-binding protein, partial [Clostridia bacterium]|nr:extracellular solute-binding protein [Clostridia bacterium]
MKKIVSIILIAVLAVSIASVLVACGGDRENELRIANWGEYMSSEVYLGFEEWYLEKTGNTIKVQYEEFDTNENLYTWISAKHEDYDLICPSDYMLQRMKTEGLLQKLSDETISVLNAKINPDVINMVKNSYDSEFAYTMPYVWGTLGIMFNVNSDGTVGLQNELDVMSNWSVLWNNSYKDKIFMKDSVRDAYTVATIYDKSAQLNEYLGADKNYDNADYQALLQSIFSTTDANMIARAKTLLLQQKANVYDYEVDSAKDELLRDVDGKNGRLGLF